MPDFADIPRGSTTQRGYGNGHIRQRRAMFAALPEWSTCCICRRRMWKHAVVSDGKGGTRSAVHLAHNQDRTGYLGFAHAACNLRDGATVGGRRARRTQPPQRRRSRIW